MPSFKPFGWRNRAEGAPTTPLSRQNLNAAEEAEAKWVEENAAILESGKLKGSVLPSTVVLGTSNLATPASLQGAPTLASGELVGYSGSGFVPVINKAAFWTPPGVVDESISRGSAVPTSVETASGRLSLAGNLVIPAGVSVGHVAFGAGQAPVGPEHWWFCIVDLAEMKIRAISADQTTTAWEVNKRVTLAMGSPYVPSVDTAVYAGVMMANSSTVLKLAATQGTSQSMEASSAVTPHIAGYAGTKTYTTPPSVGTSVEAIASATERLGWAQLST